MAILNALAAQWKVNLSDLLLGINNRPELPYEKHNGLELRKGNSKNEKNIEICALVNCEGSPSEVAYVVSELVEEGFSTVKLKVIIYFHYYCHCHLLFSLEDLACSIYFFIREIVKWNFNFPVNPK
jgi:hypothetical protein